MPYIYFNNYLCDHFCFRVKFGNLSLLLYLEYLHFLEEFFHSFFQKLSTKNYQKLWRMGKTSESKTQLFLHSMIAKLTISYYVSRKVEKGSPDEEKPLQSVDVQNGGVKLANMNGTTPKPDENYKEEIS